jgi:5-methylcytosine-specific restriction enzyme subunit McrC
MNIQSFAICEYGTIHEGKKNDQITLEEIELDTQTFTDLCDFISLPSKVDELAQVFEVTQVGSRKSIKVKNFVGYVRPSPKLSLEILPKIFSTKSSYEEALASSRSVMVRLIARNQKVPFRAISNSLVGKAKQNTMFEFFFNQYLIMVEGLVNSRMASGYHIKQEWSGYVRGKILLNQSTRNNGSVVIGHLCEFDEFSQDIAPNRVIFATLNLLSKVSRDTGNRNLARKLLSFFPPLNFQRNVSADVLEAKQRFQSLSQYSVILEWSEMFLDGMQFTNTPDKISGISFLFPMEKLFETYIANLLRQKMGKDVLLQHQKYYFAESRQSELPVSKRKRYLLLKPDIYISSLEAILDTKWKALNGTDPIRMIDPADFYQMFSYGRLYANYTLNNVIPILALIYPKNEALNQSKFLLDLADGMRLHILTFDLENPDVMQELDSLLANIRSSD